MKTLIERAVDKGWVINAGTLQARGLFNAVRNGAATDDDVTVWCNSPNDAARAALNISATGVKNKPVKRKRWTIYDPRNRQYVCAFDGVHISWSYKKDAAYAFETKADATAALHACRYVPTRYVITAHEVRS